jgi:hypothetical protein
LNYANLRIAANSVYQADLLTLLGDQARTAGMTLDVTSNVPVYAYGAVVRNASGDPYFVIGVPKPARPAPITPACETPAPLHESDDNLPTYIVVFHQNLDAKSLAIFEAALKAFVAELTPQQIAGLRCEPEVRYIEQDSYAEPIFP